MKVLAAGSLYRQTAFELGHGQPLLLSGARKRLAYGQRRLDRLVLNTNFTLNRVTYLSMSSASVAKGTMLTGGSSLMVPLNFVKCLFMKAE